MTEIVLLLCRAALPTAGDDDLLLLVSPGHRDVYIGHGCTDGGCWTLLGVPEDHVLSGGDTIPDAEWVLLRRGRS